MAIVYNNVLFEDDVPGAKFSVQNIEDHAKRELQRWLECRGLPKNGPKQALIERCQNCIKAGRSHIIDPSIDGGVWYNKKFMPHPLGDASTSTTASTSTEALGTFPSCDIPVHFNYGHIYYYIIESNPVRVADVLSSDDELPQSVIIGITTEKPLRRGQQYVDSHHVVNVRDAILSGDYQIHADIKSSFRTIKYKAFVRISSKSGSVLFGKCECKQSALGRCSHVSALLLFLHHHISKYGHAVPTCTTLPCEWNLGSKVKKSSKISTVEYCEHDKRVIKRAAFDTRATDHRSLTMSQDKINEFVRTIQEHNVERPTMWQQILHIKYEDFSLLSHEIEIVKLQVNFFYTNLKYLFPIDGTQLLIPGTEDQRNSARWKQWRAYLLTASNCKKICCLSSKNSEKQYILNNLWFKKRITTVAMSYGIKCENTAFEKYLTLIKNLCTTNSATQTGLWISMQYPGLGCSPDGLVFRNGKRGILEIKCPKSMELFNPAEFETNLSREQIKRCFLCKEGGKYFLKPAHDYFYQIQMSMAILNVEFCDFFVWSPKGIILFTVKFDKPFWKSICHKLLLFHQQVFLPEMFLMRTPRDLSPIEII